MSSSVADPVKEAVFDAIESALESTLDRTNEAATLATRLYLKSLEVAYVLVTIEEALDQSLSVESVEKALTQHNFVAGEMIWHNTVGGFLAVVRMALDDSRANTEWEARVIREYYPELEGSRFRFTAKTLLLRTFLHSDFFAVYASDLGVTRGEVLRAYWKALPDTPICDLFCVPLQDDATAKTRLLLFLIHDTFCSVLEVGTEPTRNACHHFADASFRQVSFASETKDVDQYGFEVMLEGRPLYIVVAARHAGLVWARIRELRHHLASKAVSIPRRGRERARVIRNERKALTARYGSVKPLCFLRGRLGFPPYWVRRDHIATFLRGVQNENDFMDLMLLPILRAQSFHIEKAIVHGDDDTAQERGKDLLASRQIAGDLFFKAFVVKRGPLRYGRAGTRTHSLAATLRQVETALMTTCQPSSWPEAIRPHVVVVATTGEVSDAARRDLLHLGRSPQAVRIWDRDQLMQYYFDVGVEQADQQALLTYLATYLEV